MMSDQSITDLIDHRVHALRDLLTHARARGLRATVARRAGLSPLHVYRLATGRSRPSPATADRLIRAAREVLSGARPR